MAARMNRRLFGMLSKRLDELELDEIDDAALVVAILRRIAYTMLALFRSVTQRSDERRAAPWKTLLTDFIVALITTTEHELRDPKPLRLP